MKALWAKHVRSLLWVTAGISLISTLSFAQTAPPPGSVEPDRKSKREVVVLDRDSKELADEYLDVLQELKDVTADYRDYLKAWDQPIIVTYRKDFDRLAQNLDNGSYASDHELLSKDLQRNIEELTKLETEIRESEQVYPMKLYKLVLSLKRQLQSVEGLMAEDLAAQLADNATDLAKNISLYVKECLTGIQVRTETTTDGKTIYYFMVDKNKLLPSGHGRVVVNGDTTTIYGPNDVPEPPEPPESFTLPTPPGTPTAWAQYPTVSAAPHETGETGESKQLSSTVTVTSDKSPVYIANKLGNVTVTASDNNQISAHFDVEIAADSRQREKELLAQATLEVTSSPDGYRVTAKLPKTSGSDMRVLRSSLVVTVPSRNRVECASSFGNVQITGLTNGLSVNTSYSPVSLANIKGGVDATNSMGSLQMTNVSGTIKARDSYAPVTITACKGDIDVENSYSEVNLAGSSGVARVKNSGVVNVVQHNGNLHIDNTYGEVKVTDITGNVDAVNSYSPMTVQNIRGEVSLENTNSVVAATDIKGRLSVNNKFGQITAASLHGPLKLANVNGNVNVTLDGPLKGNSSVSTSFGNINLVMPQSSDLFLRAQTTFGDIKSFLPFSITESGLSREGVLKMGRGVDSLSLVGTNGSIIISQGH